MTTIVTQSLQEEHNGRKLATSERGVNRTVRGIIFTLLGILVFGLPLFFTGLTVQGVIFDRTFFFVICSLLAFVVWIVGGVYESRLEVRRTPLDIPILLFWAMYGIATLFSVDKWHSFTGSFMDPSRGFMVVSAAVLLYYVTVSTQSRDSLYRLVGLFASSLGIFAIWSALAISGIMREVSGILGLFSAVPASDLFSVSILLAAVFPFFVTFFLYTISRSSLRGVARGLFLVSGVSVIIACVYVLAALYLSATIIAAFIGFCVFVAYISVHIVEVSKRWLWLPLVLCFGVLPLLFILGQDVVAKKELALNQSIASGMALSWETFSNTMTREFLVGTGPSTYAYAFSHYFPESLNQTAAFAERFAFLPMYVLEMGVTTGILGGGAFIGLLIFTMSVIVFLSTQRRETNSGVSLGLWIALLVVGILSFVYGLSGSVVLPSLILCVLGAALLFVESGIAKRSLTLSLRAAPQYALASTLLLLVACIGAMALFATLGKMYAAEIYAGAAFRKQGSDIKAAIGDIERAIQLNEKEGQYAVFRGRMYLAVAVEEAKKLEGENDQERIAQIQLLQGEAIRSIARGRALLPGNIFAQEVLAQTIESFGGIEEAFTLYREASEIEPKNPMYPVKMAQMKIIQAQRKENPDEKASLFGEAERFLEDALAIKENYSEAWYQRALLAEGRETLDPAIDAARASLRHGSDMRSGLLLARLLQARGGESDVRDAETILQSILQVNNKEINAHLGLAGLYEKTGKRQEAIDAYTKARDLLPSQSEEARKQLSDIIDRMRSGGSSTAESLPVDPVTVPAVSQ